MTRLSILSVVFICVLMISHVVEASGYSNRVRVGGGGSASMPSAAPFGGAGSATNPANASAPGYDGYAQGGGYGVEDQGYPAADIVNHPKMAGFGSGFAVTNDGFVMTNYHVVDTVVETGGVVFVRDSFTNRAYQAEIIRHTKSYDMALLKIEVATIGLPYVSNTDMQRGEEVVAIGYPNPEFLGFGQKATFGRINALTIPHNDFMYQIDAPIHGGNSGGPTFARSGQVIGINSAGMDPKVFANQNKQLEILNFEDVAYTIRPEFMTQFLNGIVGPVQYSPRAIGNMQDLVTQVERSVYQILIHSL